MQTPSQNFSSENNYETFMAYFLPLKQKTEERKLGFFMWTLWGCSEQSFCGSPLERKACIGRSKDVEEVFWTSYVSSVYVLSSEWTLVSGCFWLKPKLHMLFFEFMINTYILKSKNKIKQNKFLEYIYVWLERHEKDLTYWRF